MQAVGHGDRLGYLYCSDCHDLLSVPADELIYSAPHNAEPCEMCGEILDPKLRSDPRADEGPVCSECSGPLDWEPKPGLCDACAAEATDPHAEAQRYYSDPAYRESLPWSELPS